MIHLPSRCLSRAVTIKKISTNRRGRHAPRTRQPEHWIAHHHHDEGEQAVALIRERGARQKPERAEENDARRPRMPDRAIWPRRGGFTSPEHEYRGERQRVVCHEEKGGD